MPNAALAQLRGWLCSWLCSSGVKAHTAPTAAFESDEAGGAELAVQLWGGRHAKCASYSCREGGGRGRL